MSRQIVGKTLPNRGFCPPHNCKPPGELSHLVETRLCLRTRPAQSSRVARTRTVVITAAVPRTARRATSRRARSRIAPHAHAIILAVAGWVPWEHVWVRRVPVRTRHTWMLTIITAGPTSATCASRLLSSDQSALLCALATVGISCAFRVCWCRRHRRRGRCGRCCGPGDPAASVWRISSGAAFLTNSRLSPPR